MRVAASESTRPDELPRRASFVDSFLKSPFAGIAPWILMAVISGPGRFEEAASAALGFALLVLWVGSRRGIRVHLLEAFGVGYFGVLALLGLIAPPGVINWLELWAGELTNVALAAFALVTLVIGRPFTLAYAKDTTPAEHWDSPLFLRVNYVISTVWAGSFTVSALSGLYGDAVLRDNGNFWAAWIVPIGALLFAVAFTEFYPDRAQAFPDPQAEPHAGGAPSYARLLDWFPPFVVVVGIVGSAAMRRFFPSP